MTKIEYFKRKILLVEDERRTTVKLYNLELEMLDTQIDWQENKGIAKKQENQLKTLATMQKEAKETEDKELLLEFIMRHCRPGGQE